MNIQNILKQKTWKSFNLKMTKSGFDNFSNEIIFLNKKVPQVYVHVSVDTILKNEVLRIGSAKNGIIKRWIKEKNGHNRTFLWSIGENDNYGEYGIVNAKEYPNYLTFFAGLKNLNTKVYILNCNPEDSMTNIERELRNYFKPIWENDIYKKNKPMFQKKFKEHLENISKFGGALNLINTQRKDNQKILPDVIDFCSEKKWQI